MGIPEKKEIIVTDLKQKMKRKMLWVEKGQAKFIDRLASGVTNFEQWFHTPDLEKLIREQRLPRFSAEMEQAFQDDCYVKTIDSARMTLILALVLYATSGILDSWALPLTQHDARFMRLAAIVVVIVPVLVISFYQYFKKYMQLLSSIVVLTIGLNILIICAISKQEELGYTFYHAGLILVILSGYTVAHLRFTYATITGWTLVIAFEIVAIFIQDMLNSSQEIIQFSLANFVFMATNFIGMLANYYIEVFRRRDFLHRTIIEQEQIKAETLLLNILPAEIVTALKTDNRVMSEYFDQASILFADVVDFTALSADMKPVELVELLNEVFSGFDDLVDKYKLEKIKTIGDCYMVAAGVPKSRPDHAHVMAQLALDMNDYVLRKVFLGKYKLTFRIGINSGPVVAGVIGQKKFLYDLWGDTVNTASRMESLGRGGKIQITRSTYEIIKDDFSCESQGSTLVKGKGEMEVWFVSGENGEASAE
ncbi:adenylate/guanylate cyclase domain-containing protein [candidate division CSSED10-310 bacterium]|uniref:Adenylate/guanylate cyclase domain-containing protein n=1 Tax=candidate division CSSED10-310 bacterium TaxID=2855610 RepID=A0ABV6Z298_UNCC1